MQLKINEAASLAGVTVRTLHYYDKIGLLHPSMVTEAGYRLYDRQDMERLQQILFYRELDFPLAQIGRLLDSPDFDRSRAMKAHRELLMKKKERLERLIDLAERSMRGEKKMSFQEFDTSEIEECRQKYAREAEERWGRTDAYKESAEKTAGYDKGRWKEVKEEGDEIMKAFAEKVGCPPQDEAVQALVKRWQDYITASYYQCTDEILKGLGQMYVGDERFRENIDRFGEGTAELMAEAIGVYTGEQ